MATALSSGTIRLGVRERLHRCGGSRVRALSLRSRLLAALTAVMLGVIVVVGVVSVVEMRSYLGGRLDHDVVNASARTTLALAQPRSTSDLFGPAPAEGKSLARTR